MEYVFILIDNGFIANETADQIIFLVIYNRDIDYYELIQNSLIINYN
jgi:hypothetical protein